VETGEGLGVAPEGFVVLDKGISYKLFDYRVISATGRLAFAKLQSSLIRFAR
jgi:hypothetical protein